MSTAWQVVVLATALSTAINAVLMLGILRRATDALERATISTNSRTGPMLFDPSTSALGQIHILPGVDPLPDEHFVVTFLEHGCDSCRELATDVTRTPRRAKTNRPVLIFVLDSDQAPFDSLIQRYTCVVDVDHRTSDEWQVHGTPRSFFVEPTGFVLATNTLNTFRDLVHFAQTSETQALDDHAGHDHGSQSMSSQ